MFDYVEGKIDWFAHALPREGDAGPGSMLGDLASADVPKIDPGSSCADAREIVDGAPVGVVLNAEGVLLGVVTSDDLTEEGKVADVMDFGASTFRPHVPVGEMAHYVEERSLDRVIVTTSSGEFVGIVGRDALQEQHQSH